MIAEIAKPVQQHSSQNLRVVVTFWPFYAPSPEVTVHRFKGTRKAVGWMRRQPQTPDFAYELMYDVPENEL
jgi:hypothetical protein